MQVPSQPEVRDSFRRQMPVARRWAYFDHAAVAPLSQPAQEALRAWGEQATDDGDVHCPDWALAVERVRTSAAAMINAPREQVAFVANTTAGINIVAEGFPWREGDNVVIRADEYPSNQYPWLHLARRGVETRRLECPEGTLDFDALEAHCDDRTRIISLSWVTYSGGYRHDLDRLCEFAHRRGILLFVDAIQGLGVFPLDVAATPIDFLAADGHKWMLGPEGAGVFYLRAEHLDRLVPTGVGWNSVINELEFHKIDLTLKPNALRYEGGSQNSAGIVALGASLDLLCGFGQPAVARAVFDVTDRVCQRLLEIGAVVRSPRSRENRSGIVTFELPGRDLEQCPRRCREADVVFSCRAGRLRVSPHAYNNEEDVDRLIDALKSTP